MRLRSLKQRLAVASGIGALVGVVSFGGLSVGMFGGYRLQLTDNLFPSGATDPRVEVVAIDSRSISRVGQWPWPRGLQAALVRELAERGASTIVLDVVFDPGAPGDDVLARAIREHGSVVLASLADYRVRRGATLRVATDITEPVPSVARAAARIGHAHVTQDPADGVVRSLPVLLDTPDGDLHPSLALASYIQAEGLDPIFTLRPDGIQVQSTLIPTGPLGDFSINYSPELVDLTRNRAPAMSAVDVLRGADASFDGKVVMVGVTDPAVGDDRPTPVDKANQMPGILIHANALNTMLTGNWLQPAGDVRTALSSAVLAFVVAAITLLGPVWLGPIGLAFAFVGYGLWAFVRFASGHVLDLLYPLLAVIVGFVVALGVRYLTELRGRRRVSALFSQYVPRSVAYQLLDEDRVDLAVRGERVELTVLFCDLRGFTAQSAKLEPARVRDLINIYYDETSRLVQEHNGTLLNFVGDEVFAVWGAPIADPHSAAHAVACARAFQDAAPLINQRLQEAGLPAIDYGVGLHTGEAVAAHVGTETRRQYTVLGDTVNCGSRLCTVAGRGEIVVSEQTYVRLQPRPPAEVLPGIRLKGVGRELLPHRLWPDELKDPSGQARGKVES